MQQEGKFGDGGQRRDGICGVIAVQRLCFVEYRYEGTRMRKRALVVFVG